MALLGMAYEGVVVEERLPFLKLRLKTGGYTHVRAQKGLAVGDRVKFYYEPRHDQIVEVLTIAEWEEEQRLRQIEIDNAVKKLRGDGSGHGVLIEEEEEPCLEEEGEPGDYEM